LAEVSGAKALIECLKREGVHTVFGMPGGANLPIYDELYNSGIRHVMVRHEQSAGHMADGFARAARRPGVCFATSGPGATNLVTPLATAHLDSSPVVAITGQVQRTMIGRDGFQETDIIGVITPVTKYCHQIRTSEELIYEVRKAFYISNSGRPGPVLIDVPKDLQTAKMRVADDDIYGSAQITVRGYSPPSAPDPKSVATAALMLANATKPMILAGGGVTIAGAFSELQAVAELLQCPVVTTFKGKGCFPENHPLSIGPIGMHGHVEANRLILEADVLLAAGARFSDRSVGKFDEFGMGMRIIHADIDPSEIGKNKAVDHAVIGDIRQTLAGLATELLRLVRVDGSNDYTSQARNVTWMKRVKEVRALARENEAKNLGDKDLTAKNVLRTLRKVLPPNTVTTTEVGQCQMWSSLFFDVIQPGTFFSSTGLGTMGFGFPAAVGAKVARPDCPAVDIAGDGSFNMTENSLATCVTERIPVVAMIMNNDMLGMVAQWQRMFYNRRLIGVRMNGVPDFVRLAQAYGAQGYHVDSIEEFEKAMREAITNEVASVVDVPIHPEEDVFPFVIPGTALKDMVVA
jgi:acetolactate synthase-1/2/3 large subunit